MKRNIKNNNKGFTIIEVLIVLVIAGLIMLIVFLAVPALQRNSRNTQRKNDVAGVLGAISEWSNNNNGTLPSGATQQDAALLNAKTGFYTGSITFAAGAATVTNSTTESTLVIVTGAKCATAGTPATNTGNATSTGASSRAVAALYTVESGGSTTTKICQEG